MHDLAIFLAYLSSALVLTWVAMCESARFRGLRTPRRIRFSESEAHIFCCWSLAAAYAFHALA